MTLPEQSNRAVKQTREFLVRLSSPFVEGGIKGIRREIRAEALALLRHYPYVWIEQQGGEDTGIPTEAWTPVSERLRRLSGSGDCPVADNAAKRDNTPPTHATPSEGREQNGCTLTAEEREAVERAADLIDAKTCGSSATLRGLLERTK